MAKLRVDKVIDGNVVWHEHKSEDVGDIDALYLSRADYDDIFRFGLLMNYAGTQETTYAFDGTNTYTLTPTGASWSYWRNGTKYTITGAKTVTLTATPPATKGTYFIYIDGTDGTLIASTSSWTLADTKVPVAIINWDNALTPKYHIQDERHTCAIDRRFHFEHHFTDGTETRTMTALSGYSIAPAVPVDTDNTMALSEAIIIDEDLSHTLAALADQNGTDKNYYVWYRNGAGIWNWISSEVPFLYTAAGYIQYDNAGTMTEGAGNKYYNTYLLLTTLDGVSRFAFIHGQAPFNTLALAQAESFTSLTKTGLGLAEYVAAYQLTWETSAAYSTKGKCRLAAAPKAINVSATGFTTGGAIEHNTLAGLQGGTTGEYYHMTSSEYTAAQAVPSTYLKLDCSNDPLTASLSFEGNATKTLTVDRHTTADTAGNSLTIQAGGATSGATNKPGGALILNPGQGTGSTSTTNIVKINSWGGNSGTTDQVASRSYNFLSTGIGVDTTTIGFRISFNGADTTPGIGVNRHTTADTAGNILTVQSGGATSGATDKAGGALYLKSGISTGTGAGDIYLQTCTPGSTGTSDNSFATRMTVNSSGVGIGITPTSALDVQGISTAGTLGTDLVTNGEFDAGDTTNWALGATWSVISTNHYKFTISSTTGLPSFGQTFTNSGFTYTVYGYNYTTTSSPYAGTLYCTGTGTPSASGTLVKGTAPADATYTAYAVNYVANHTAGENTLVKTLTLTSGQTYEVSFLMYTSTIGVVTAKLGTSTATVMGGHRLGTAVQYNIQFNNLITSACIATNGNNLTITPDATWEGWIDQVTVKLLTPASNTVNLRNSNGTLISALGGNASGSATLGHLALTACQSAGINNTALGGQSLRYNTVGTANIAIGITALINNTTGINNTAIGAYSMYYNLNGAYNLALGQSALYTNVSGDSNTALGNQALALNTSGRQNLAIGLNALYANTTGFNNVGVGIFALRLNTTGTQNTALGVGAGFSNTTGSNSVYLGFQAGYYETGSNKFFVDNTARASEADGRVKALMYGIFSTTTAGQSLYLNSNVIISDALTVNDSGSAAGDFIVEGDTEANMIFNDASADKVYFGGNSATTSASVTKAGLFYPVQAPTASAPSYVKGAIYFDTTLNKLRVGGASAWETITSS